MAVNSNTHTTEGNVTYMNTPQTIELDGRALKAEAEKSREFQTLLFYGANRERDRDVTDIEQMRRAIEQKHNEELDSDKWLKAFKKLEDMGLGALILGRRGKPNRFRWNYSLKSIGTAAVNGMSLTAYRIVPKMKGGKVINDYQGVEKSRPDAVEKPTKPSVKLGGLAEYDDDEEAPPAPRARVAAPKPQAKASSALNMLYIPLRADYAFEAEIPNLTAQEADAICAVIRRCVKK